MSEKESKQERIYTIPLGRAWIAPRWRRAEKAISLLRKFVKRHMKPNKTVIEPSVNEKIWRNGAYNPPRKIRVKLSKDDEDTVTVSLAGAKL